MNAICADPRKVNAFHDGPYGPPSGSGPKGQTASQVGSVLVLLTKIKATCAFACIQKEHVLACSDPEPDSLYHLWIRASVMCISLRVS